ncbi:hypothetical protein GCM10009809_01060 [Isoptericola hypogeus]|uniref:N-acetyltransferase domain-containing protein n=2 Tax=Isoptericola hypogeus TaxID=300179 RepID=A0ABN2INL3_9MICO
MTAHIGTHLTPAAFRGWAESDRHALLVAVPADEVATLSGASGGEGAMLDGRHMDDAPLGYALVALGRPDGSAEADVLRAVAGPGPYAELSKIYVLPEAQGSGVAGLLMDASVTAARELAARAGSPAAAIWLGTNGENRRAQAFYRKHGFEVVGRRTYDVGGVVHDDVVMLHRPA